MGRKKQPGTPYVKLEKGYPYYYVTYQKGKRKTLHRLTWEAANGPVPAGHVIRFRDGDTLNCNINNLYVATRADFANENRNLNTCYEAAKRFYQTEEGKAVLRKKADKMRGHWRDGTFPVEQRKQTVLTRVAAGLIKPGMGSEPADSHIVYWLAPNDPEMRQLIKQEAPELIAYKRIQLKLRSHLKTLKTL